VIRDCLLRILVLGGSYFAGLAISEALVVGMRSRC
jgi:hypothetical protein